MGGRDEFFAGQEKADDFAFDDRVVQVFDDMVSRSVPFYTEAQHMQTDLITQFLPAEEGLVCDLGCSTGTTIDLLTRHPRCPATAKFIGYDNSEPMLSEAAHKLAKPIAQERVRLLDVDLNAGIELPECNVVLMNWTLQFVRPLYRESLVRRIFETLRPGGALFLSEKVLVSDSMLNRLYIDFYLNYKRTQGYSDTEIVRKREALENVLIPYRVEENYELLGRCGFGTVDIYFRWFNFACFLAVKR